MAKQVIGIGNTPNDGLGDDLRTAFSKANSNFTELYHSTGEFLPTVKFGGAGVGVTYTTQNGRYVRTINLVYFQIEILLSSKGSSTGNVTIEDLPFAAKSTTPTKQGPFACEVLTSTLSDKQFYGLITQATSKLSLFIVSGTGNAAVANTQINNTTSIWVTGMYEAAP